MTTKLTEQEIVKWLNGLAAFDAKNEAVMMAIMSVLGIPPSHLDVGSGTGAMVNIARKCGSDAWGIDLLPRPDWAHLIEHDLTEPIDLGRKFNLITSVEVAEHIPIQGVEVYLDTIAKHAEQGTVLVFSAAMPGQQGDGHVNCQPAEYWRAKLDARGFRWNDTLTYKIMVAMSVAKHSMHWIEANLQVFRYG